MAIIVEFPTAQDNADDGLSLIIEYALNVFKDAKTIGLPTHSEFKQHCIDFNCFRGCDIEYTHDKNIIYAEVTDSQGPVIDILISNCTPLKAAFIVATAYYGGSE